VPKLSIYFEKILSRAHGKSEEQNNTLEPSIIIINRFIVINSEYYNYIVSLINSTIIIKYL
jgi:hypothetical protein